MTDQLRGAEKLRDISSGPGHGTSGTSPPGPGRGTSGTPLRAACGTLCGDWGRGGGREHSDYPLSEKGKQATLRWDRAGEMRWPPGNGGKSARGRSCKSRGDEADSTGPRTDIVDVIVGKLPGRRRFEGVFSGQKRLSSPLSPPRQRLGSSDTDAAEARRAGADAHGGLQAAPSWPDHEVLDVPAATPRNAEKVQAGRRAPGQAAAVLWDPEPVPEQQEAAEAEEDGCGALPRVRQHQPGQRHRAGGHREEQGGAGEPGRRRQQRGHHPDHPAEHQQQQRGAPQLAEQPPHTEREVPRPHSASHTYHQRSDPAQSRLKVIIG